jgi:Fe2+ or Zn2+ uptake regulation protein
MVLKILENYKITPSEQRVRVLEIVISLSLPQFSAEDVIKANSNHEMFLNKSVVNKILRLYCVRGIINSVEQRKTQQRGRPELLFSIAYDLKNQYHH